jgi:hypothetical protein
MPICRRLMFLKCSKERRFPLARRSVDVGGQPLGRKTPLLARATTPNLDRVEAE